MYHSQQPNLPSARGDVSVSRVHVVVTRTSGGFNTVYTNGVIRSRGRIGGSTGNWNDTYPLLLGNEADLSRQWLGTFHRVAIHDRAFTEAEVGHNFAVGPD